MEKCEHVFKRVNKSNYTSNDIRNFTTIFICTEVIIYNQCTIKILLILI